MNTKVTIACPTNRGLHPSTMQCLLELIAKGGYDFHLIVPEEGYTIAENRNYIVAQTLLQDSDYLLMVDDDMTFEKDMLDKLIADDKDIIGVAYHPRTDMGDKIKWLDETHHISLSQNKDPKYKKTFECHATGTGIILINCEVLKKMPQPHFAFEYYENGACKLGEDWYFSREAKKQGFKIWTNPNIEVGHWGEKIY